MPAIDATGFLIGTVLLIAVRFVPQLISALAFWLLLVALAAGFGIDLLLWFSRGIHAIELDGDTLTLHRGRRHSIRQLIERASVRSVRSRRSWGGQTVEIGLQRPAVQSAARRDESVTARLVSRLLGRDRVLLRDDVFDREAFAGLAERLAAWKG
jgi:hypothetical protein